VKIRRDLVHLLFALLLVLSQQMGISHAVSHLSSVRLVAEQVQGPGQDADGSASTALALDQNCSQCLAFAQIASAIDTPFYSFPALLQGASLELAFATPQACQRTVCVFRSRAPPVFA
jgi:hypothetical protein